MDPIMASAGLSAIGDLFSGIGSFFGAQNRAKALKYQAQAERDQAGVDAQIAVDQGERASARAATIAASSGGGALAAGDSSLDVLGDLSRQSMFNARTAAYEGIVRGNAAQDQASQALFGGWAGLAKSVSGAAGDFLGGAAKASEVREQAALRKKRSQWSTYGGYGPGA